MTGVEWAGPAVFVGGAVALAFVIASVEAVATEVRRHRRRRTWWTSQARGWRPESRGKR
jgi:hypothetical protein